ncbi:WD repeat-containing protein 78 [Scaptodrosophila lebanonensis]|uniref:Dynein axonemal intermediate chain 4 n=1 Tax=Drosophila lebanonensis TaxID=7225 RepID=A0A6J2TFI9_DROLE|nr:WD repeat-containing protein 78 [Scaptodrosophila lebanonensis]
MKKSTIETKGVKKSVQVIQEATDEPAKKKKEEYVRREDLHSYAQEIQADLQNRQQFKVTENVNGEEVDMTPKYIPDDLYSQQFLVFNDRLKDEVENMAFVHVNLSQSQSRTRGSMRAGVGGNKQSIDDLMNGIMYDTILFEPPTEDKPKEEAALVPYTKSFVKVTLKKTEFVEIFTQNSTTVLKGSPEADEVEKDNRQYDYLTVGKGKVRRRSDNDAQTNVVLMTSRAVNTIMIDSATVGSYVSNFEMYDTVHNLVGKHTITTLNQSLIRLDSEMQTDQAYDNEEEDEEREKAKTVENRLFDSTSFKNAIMFMGRAISSNIHEAGMRRFRNFEYIDRCSTDAEYNYSMDLLFRCIPSPSFGERKAVSDISFCRSNGDIFVVAYGLYSFSSQHVPKCGDVFVWSIKNPGEPERAFYYKIPVTAVRFSPFLPSLIAIGMYDGTVEVRDVTNPSDPPIAISQRSTSPGCSPVVSIRWIKQSESGDGSEIDPFLSLSQDGSVTRFRIIKSPFLLGFNQMTLERVEGAPEGIHVPISPVMTCESNRHPQGLYVTTHPLHKDIYYVLTDEGCIHKCSINYQHQYLEVLKCHDGGVNVMEFSPWSPKLFLTCGNDWYVRIWLDGITRPLIELQDNFQPVHWANWSPTHSTIIVALNRETVQIWDIRRNILKPMAEHEMDSSFNTVAQFSNCGRTVAIGNERGNVLFQSLDDMPFEPHFQYDELEKAIYKAIGNDQELLIELKSVGFFGYPNKKSVQPS